MCTNARKKAALVIVPVAIAVVVIAVLAVNMAPQAAGGQQAEKPLKTSLQGSGATFPYPQLSEWIKRFGEKSGITINYQAVGSGAGQSQFFDGVVDFACSDPPLSREQWTKRQGEVMQVPWLLGAVAVVYNVPELPSNRSLKLSGEVLAGIYKGEIALWSDPKIKELNPELADALPSKRIIAVYRADSSGTTEIFTTFLYKSAPSAWSKELVGKKVAWPVEQAGRSVGAQGNPGVVQVVLNSPYSIGYVELSYAVTHGMRTASLQNREGVFVQPTVESMQEAARNVSMPSSPLDDFSRTLDEVVFTPGEGSYPASSFTYVFLWKEYRDKDKESALSAFLRWVAGEGYGCLVDGYAPPPPSAVQLLLKAAEVLEG